ncbi:Thioredoxin [Teratosphaeria destructans]|uniref:Thioredoxin n=1 Tax=Teratosphaeria destructans TaxID=418781 RepID=A0A9W7STI2_9PEZI|nr:Thioredoxin [Teratosphaeria destructans]
MQIGAIDQKKLPQHTAIMVHQELGSREDFDNAIKSNPGKHVFIMAYEGTAPADADEHAAKHSDKVASYKFDLNKAPQAKNVHGIEKTPSALIYKDGQLVKKVDGMDPTELQEVGKMLGA